MPPTPEWGAMVAEGRELTAQWWVSTFPGLAIFTVALAANFVGDGFTMQSTLACGFAKSPRHDQNTNLGGA